jgi:uncharacterized protein (TIGR02058 family)
MALKRCIVEMGVGVDLHGGDYTKAAQRAVANALWHNSLTFPRAVGKGPEAMQVDVTIAVAEPDSVDGDAVLGVLPYGERRIQIVKGGLNIPSEDGSDVTIMANAAVVVSMEL